MIGFLLALMVATVPPPLPDTPIVEAVASCVGDAVDLGDGVYFVEFTTVSIHDDGQSVVLAGDGAFSLYSCVAESLELPEWTRSVMDHTSSTFGLVEVELEGYSAMWSYHPDNGAFVVLYDAALRRDGQ